MQGSSSNTGWASREQRIRVVLPVRMRAGPQWHDACVLNLSSRGVLLYSQSDAVSQGDVVELRKGEHVIVARVVWRKSCRMGLRANGLLPVERILSLHQEGTAPVQTGSRQGAQERRQRPRTAEDHRLRARAIEFASVALVGAVLAGTTFAIARDALSMPLQDAASVLKGHTPASAEAK